MTVAIVHPQVQHSRQVARALEDAGILAKLYTSIFVNPDRLHWLPGSLQAPAGRRWSPFIPAGKVETVPIHEIIWLATRRLMWRQLGERSYYWNVWAFDRAVSRRLRHSDAKIVVGYENSSRDTFRAARRAGKYCVLDAASVHYRAQYSVCRPPCPAGFLEKINSRKEEEIRLADHVLTLSSYARQTYLDAGLPAGKVSVIPLGVDVKLFRRKRPLALRDTFRFLFVGNRNISKGMDILVRAFQQVSIANKELVIIGASGDADHLLGRPPAGVLVRGYMSNDQLLKEYEAADVFVLPSRLDGFGMVVAEAMSTGTPVIVSSHVGAKDLVQEGINGWVFESGSAESLAWAMQETWEGRDRLQEMGQRAREQIEGHTWERYRNEIQLFYRQLLSRHP